MLIASAIYFADASYGGVADCNGASDVYGVRPYFLLR